MRKVRQKLNFSLEKKLEWINVDQSSSFYLNYYEVFQGSQIFCQLVVIFRDFEPFLVFSPDCSIKIT